MRVVQQLEAAATGESPREAGFGGAGVAGRAAAGEVGEGDDLIMRSPDARLHAGRRTHGGRRATAVY